MTTIKEFLVQLETLILILMIEKNNTFKFLIMNLLDSRRTKTHEKLSKIILICQKLLLIINIMLKNSETR